MMPLWIDLDELTDDGGMWDQCPNCGAIFGGDEYVAQRCYSCGWGNGDETDDTESEDEDE